MAATIEIGTTAADATALAVNAETSANKEIAVKETISSIEIADAAVIKKTTEENVVLAFSDVFKQKVVSKDYPT